MPHVDVHALARGGPLACAHRVLADLDILQPIDDDLRETSMASLDLQSEFFVPLEHAQDAVRAVAEVASGWGRSGRGSGSQYSRWAPNIAVARRIWLPGASIMEDY